MHAWEALMLERSAQQPRRPSALTRGSVALHLAAAGVMLARPPLWPWALSAMIADHLLLTAAGLWPRSRLLGPNWTRLPAAAAAGGPPAAPIAIPTDHGPDPHLTPPALPPPQAHGAHAP